MPTPEAALQAALRPFVRQAIAEVLGRPDARRGAVRSPRVAPEAITRALDELLGNLGNAPLDRTEDDHGRA